MGPPPRPAPWTRRTLSTALADVDVFARVRPEQKLLLVERVALQDAVGGPRVLHEAGAVERGDGLGVRAAAGARGDGGGARRLSGWLAKLTNRNAQKEYYLTDVVKLAVAEGLPVTAVKIDDAWQVAGVNSKRELAALERQYQKQQAGKLLDAGVTLADPARIDVRGELSCGQEDVLTAENVTGDVPDAPSPR